MPGVVGLVRRDRGVASLEPALRSLSHLPTYHTREIPLAPGVVLGEALPREPIGAAEPTWALDGAGETGVLVGGHVLLDGDHPRRLSARDILSDVQRHGFDVLSSYDGSFCVVVVNLVSRELHVVNDRLGLLPIYYRHDDEVFAFGPEAKAVTLATGKPVRLDEIGLLNFISAGYCYHDRTVFDEIRVLTPGTHLTLDLDALTLTRRRHWRMVFERDPDLDDRTRAEDALHDALLRAHELALADAGDDVDLLLSGGLDSRGILAFLRELDRLPRRALSFGLSDAYPNSDGWLARRMAAHCGVPFEFLSFDTDAFAGQAERWCAISELANDNVGWYAEGVGALTSFFSVAGDFTLVGDETWGGNGWVFSRDEAIAINFPGVYPRPLDEALRADRVPGLLAAYRALIDRSLAEDVSTDWLDTKDYLYTHVRLARFIGAVGYWKEIATPIRRPFLANRVVEVIRRMPGRYRNHKGLYVSMLRRRFPDLAAFPGMKVSGLPDWRYDIRRRPGVTEHFRALLNPDRVLAGPLGRAFDPDAYRRIHDRFLDGDARATARSRGPGAYLMRWALRSFGATRGYAEAVRLYKRFAGGTANAVIGDYEFLRRVALVSLLDSVLPAFESDGARRAVPGQRSRSA